MAVWGTNSYWGNQSYWGVDTGNGPQEFCQIARQRLLSWVFDDPDENFPDLVCIFTEPLGHRKDVLEDIMEAFDLSTANGEQLDIIGRVVGLPRRNFPDSRYRTFLQIQTELVLSANREDQEWTGTAPNLIEIAARFINNAAPVVYNDAPPGAYVMSVPGITSIDELNLLVDFLCQATYATVIGNIKFALDPNSKWASIHGAVANSGIYCSIHGAVPGCAKYGHLVQIGLQPCL